MTSFVARGNNGWVTTQFDKTDTTLANVTRLSVQLIKGKTYHFLAILYVLPSAVGGQKFTLASDGTLAVNPIRWTVKSLDTTTGTWVIDTKTALGSFSSYADTANIHEHRLEGTCTVSAATTTFGSVMSVQFAQSVANGTSSVLVGSFLEVVEL